MADSEEESMSAMIASTAARLFAGMAAQAFAVMPRHPDDGAIGWQAEMWDAVEELGFPLSLLDEASGGFGVDPLTALGLVRQAATCALPLPLGETMLAHLVTRGSGLDLPDGPAALVTGLTLSPQGDGWRASGTAMNVPWGRTLAALVLVDTTGRVAVATGGWSVTEGRNLAGEPRDRLAVDLTIADQDCGKTAFTPDLVMALGALMRAQALAGALEGVLERTIAYANTRVQFGRPLAKFQAIQHNIAVMATNTAAARAGADMAATARFWPIRG